MERKLYPAPLPDKLIETVARNYLGTEISVSFPNDWALVHRFRHANKLLYIAGLPPTQERARTDHYVNLPPEINRSLTTYRLYKLVEPWITSQTLPATTLHF